MRLVHFSLSTSWVLLRTGIVYGGLVKRVLSLVLPPGLVIRRTSPTALCAWGERGPSFGIPWLFANGVCVRRSTRL